MIKGLIVNDENYNNLKKDLDKIMEVKMLRNTLHSLKFFDRVKKTLKCLMLMYTCNKRLNKLIKVIENEKSYKLVLPIWLLLYTNKLMTNPFNYKCRYIIKNDATRIIHNQPGNILKIAKLDISVEGINIDYKGRHFLTWHFISEPNSSTVRMPFIISLYSTINSNEHINCNIEIDRDLYMSNSVDADIDYMIFDILKTQVLNSLNNLMSYNIKEIIK